MVLGRFWNELDKLQVAIDCFSNADSLFRQLNTFRASFGQSDCFHVVSNYR